MKSRVNLTHRFLVILLAAGWIAAGCSAESPTPAQPTAAPSALASSTPPATVTPSPTPLPTDTPLPSATATATLTPTPSATPLPWAQAAISPANLDGLTGLARWGNGRVDTITITADGRYRLVKTALGLDVLAYDSRETILSVPDARTVFYRPDQSVLAACFKDGSCQAFDSTNWQPLAATEIVADIPPLIKQGYLAERPELLPQVTEDMATAKDAEVSLDGKILAVGFRDGTTGVFELSSGQLLAKLRHDLVLEIYDVFISPDSSQVLVVAMKDWRTNILAAYDLAAQNLAWYVVNPGSYSEQPFSADGRYLAAQIRYSTSEDRTVVVLDARNGLEVGQVSGQVLANPFDAEGKRMLVVSHRKVSVIELPTFFILKRLDSDLDWPEAVFDPGGEQVILNGGQLVWSLTDDQVVAGSPEPARQAEPGELDPYEYLENGYLSGLERILQTGEDRLEVWGSRGQQVYQIDMFNRSVSWQAFSSPLMADPASTADGRVAAACTEAGLEVIVLQSGESRVFDACREPASVALSSDGRWIARSSGVLIELVDAQTGDIVQQYRGHTYPVNFVGFSPDDSLLVSSAKKVDQESQTQLRLWRVSPARAIGGELQVGFIETQDLTFSPDGSTLVGESGGQLMMWRTSDGSLAQYRNWEIYATALAFSPAGDLLAIGDFNGKLHLVAYPQLEVLKAIDAHSGPIWDIAFLEDGANLLTAGLDGTVRLWGLP